MFPGGVFTLPPRSTEEDPTFPGGVFTLPPRSTEARSGGGAHRATADLVLRQYAAAAAARTTAAERAREVWARGQARAAQELERAPLVRVCVVGCGAQKLERAAPAAELYTGSLFRLARRYAEALGPWLILSAKHGIIPPHRVIEPYDQRAPKEKVEARLFARRAAAEIRRTFGRDPIHVVILAGATYADPLALELLELGIDFEAPLEGLELGARLHWLKVEAAKAAEAKRDRQAAAMAERWTQD